MKRTVAYVFLVFCILLCSACGDIQADPATDETASKPEETFSTSEANYTPAEEASSTEKIETGDLSETDSDDDSSDEASSETSEAFSFEELFNISAHIDPEKLSRFDLDYSYYASEGPILHDFLSTADEEVLNSIIDYIKTVRFIPSDSLTAEVGEYTVTLFEGDRSFELSFNAKNEFVVDGNIYTSSLNFPTRGKYDTSYYYIEARDYLKLSSYGTVTDLTDFDLSEIHLLPIYIDSIGPDCTKDADLIVDGKTFQIRSADIIDCRNWGYYRVVSDKDFSSLIPENETTSMIRFEYEYDNGSSYAFVSNNVIYTAEEIRALVSSRATQILNSDGSEYTDRIFTGNETLTVKFDYNYGSTVSYAGSTDDERFYKDALNSSFFPQIHKYEHHAPIFRFDTLEDLERFKSTYGDKIDFDLSFEEVYSFNEATGEYDDRFFEEYSLILVYVHSGSSSYRYENEIIQVSRGGYLYVNVSQANDPEELQELEASWFVTVVCPDDYFDDDTKFDAKIVGED